MVRRISTPARPAGYIWIETPWKEHLSVRAEEFEIEERKPERRRPDRLDDRELAVEVLPNAAGGVIVKVSHTPTRRYATASHRDAEIAKRQAKAQLARAVARSRRREEKGL